MAVRAYSRLYRNRHGTFYYRLALPADLAARFGQREIRVSTGTEQRAKALQMSLTISSQLPLLLHDLRTMSETTSPHELDLKAEIFRLKIAEAHTTQQLNELANELQQRIIELERENRDLKEQLGSMVPRDHAREIVKRTWVTAELKGKNDTEDKLVFPWPHEKTKLFSELLDAYLRSRTEHRGKSTRAKKLTPKAHDAYRAEIGQFIWVMGDMRIGAIDREVTGEYFSKLCKLPANTSRVARFKGKTPDQIIAMNEKPQSEGNASKKMERASTMFKWALGEKRKWGIDANPFEGFGQSSDNESPRRPFTEGELKALLSHPTFLNKKFRAPYGYWLIPLGLYTGARIGELCQLDLKDFVVEQGIPCIDINDFDAREEIEEGGRKKHVKTKNAKRLVPIHPELIRLGLLDYVSQLRKRKEIHLFPELNRERRDGPAQAPSNWFQRYRAKVGITEKQTTVFHSFRHYFITKILDNGESPYLLAPIVGHERDLVTGNVYWNVKNDVAKREKTVLCFKLSQEVADLIPPFSDVKVTPDAARKKTT